MNECKSFRVIMSTKCICQTCGGTGYVQHPYWEMYWEEHTPGAPDPGFEDWWSNMGFSLTSIPPEEIACPDCEGLGYQEHRAEAEVSDLVWHDIKNQLFRAKQEVTS